MVLAASVSRREVGLQELVIETAGLADSDGIGAAEAASLVLVYLSPDSNAEEHLIWRGLVAEAEARLTEARIQYPDPTPLQIAIRSRGGSSNPDYALEILSNLNILERIKLMGADRTRKVLLDFTSEDCQLHEAINTTREEASAQRAEWFKTARLHLAREGKITLRELTPSVVAELERKAEAGPWTRK